MNRKRSKRLLLLFYLIAAGVTELSAQLVMGARETAMGQAITALPAQGWSVFNNPAFLADEKRQVSFYSIRYYGLTELTDVAVQVSIPFAPVQAGIGIHHFGGELYSESRFRLAASKNFGAFSAGISGNASVFRYGGPYENQTAISLDAGIVWRASEKVFLGARSTNLAGGKQKNALVEPARELAAGIALKPSEEVLFSADLVKDVRYVASVRLGAEVMLAEILAIRVGVTTQPQTFSAGAGLYLGNLRAGFVLQRHQVGALGISPGLDLQWRF